MRKFLLPAVIAAGLIGLGPLPSAYANATPTPPSAAELQLAEDSEAALLEAHLASMKIGLQLNDDQMKSWPAFEAAIRDAAKARWTRTKDARDRMNQGERPTPIERMNIMADHLEKSAADLRKVASASQPLYASLNDTQKHSFGPLMREFRPKDRH